MSDLQKELEPFPDEAGLSFVGSVDDGGFPQVKAMLAPRGREGLRVFRFSTNASSMRVAQFRRNGAACLYFCDPRTFRGLLLTGTMEVLEDAAGAACGARATSGIIPAAWTVRIAARSGSRPARDGITAIFIRKILK